MQTLDQSRIEAFAGQIATEVGAALNAALVTVGDQLGLYRAMADAQPISSGVLAARTRTHERYVREWLNAQAAGGFVTYDAGEDSYTLPAEHAFILADESSPVAMAGIFQAATAVMDGRTRVAERFRTGEGVGWHEHHDGLFCGTERSFGANYRMHLVSEWLPALTGVVEKLERGARAADVGCGHGASTILMAQAFPASTFTGIDVHAESIATARRRAQDAGVADRVGFEVADDRGQPQSRGAHVLRILHASLHTGVALATWPCRAGHAGRRGAPARGDARGRLRLGPPRRGDAPEPGVGGPCLSALRRAQDLRDRTAPRARGAVWVPLRPRCRAGAWGGRTASSNRCSERRTGHQVAAAAYPACLAGAEVADRAAGGTETPPGW
jgi:2-polyprenyl-3-methyl-5-hydroxy-6-metoxy-1,4-benzoquinol methylase